jgi:hypothetical protein
MCSCNVCISELHHTLALTIKFNFAWKGEVASPRSVISLTASVRQAEYIIRKIWNIWLYSFSVGEV